MPYPTIQSLPDDVKALPAQAQEIWQKAYNAAHEQYKGDEEKSNAVAWAAVKNLYQKVGDRWLPKESKAMANLQLAEGKPVMLFPFGKWKTEKYGEMDLNESFAQRLISNFDDQVLGTQPFFDDGNHNEDKATGWIKRLFISANALWADVEWTELGEQLLKGRVYRYSSMHIDKHKNPVDGKEYYPVLKNVSLTNIPVLRMLPALELSEAGAVVEIPLMKQDEIIVADEVSVEAPAQEINDNDTNTDKEKQMEKDLRDLLGLGDDADVLEAVRSLKQSADKPEVESVTLSEHQRVSEEVKSLTLKLAERDRDDAVNTAIKLGKIVPAQTEWAKEYALRDPNGFAQFVAAAPVAIQLGEKGKDNTEAIELTVKEIQVAKELGLTETELREGKAQLQEVS